MYGNKLLGRRDKTLPKLTVNGVYELIYDFTNLESEFIEGDKSLKTKYKGHMYQLLTTIPELKSVKIVQLSPEKTWHLGLSIPHTSNPTNLVWTVLFKEGIR